MLENYPDVFDLKDVCAILRIGRKTAYKLMRSNSIPNRKIGKSYKITKKAMISYLEQKIIDNCQCSYSSREEDIHDGDIARNQQSILCKFEL